ncbi:hypothetical protein ABI59_18135 [Acidobacteria bacterium Mor1]|nr:hypothetical protein ABI59_18135 [Acidobacteria bacterium Mor1]
MHLRRWSKRAWPRWRRSGESSLRPSIALRAGLLIGLILCCGALPAAAEGTESDEERRKAARALAKLASGYSRAGDHQLAFQTYAKALAAARELGDGVLEGRLLRDRAQTFRRQQAWDDANRDLLAAVEAFERAGEPARAAEARLQTATRLASEQGLDAALDFVDGQMAILRELDARKYLARAVNLRARLLVNAGRMKDALAVFDASDLDMTGLEGEELTGLGLRAYAEQQSGRLEAARGSYLKVLERSFRRGDHHGVAYAFCNLGDVEDELGLTGLAEERLDAAIDLLDELRTRVAGGAMERTRFLDVQISAYHGKLIKLIDSRSPDLAFELAEGFHARSFLEVVEGADRSGGSSGAREQAVGSEEQAAFRELMALQELELREGLDAAGQERLRVAERRWSTLVREARRLNQDPVPTVVPQSIPEIRAALPEGTGFLKYWVHPKRTVYWLVTRDGIKLTQVPIASSELEARLERYLAPLRSLSRAEDVALRGKVQEHLEAGHELYRLLMEPLSRDLSELDHLIVNPHDMLWHLPFGALVRELPGEAEEGQPRPLFHEYAAAGYMADAVDFSYVHSATVWATLRARSSPAAGLLAIAPSLEQSEEAFRAGWALDPLPSAQPEATALAERWPGGRALVGAAATESAVKELLAGRRLVHFATHGRLSLEHPELSAVMLRPGAGEDGLLQAHELAGLGCAAELVSLAACDTAMGQLSRGEGLVGLGRSFLLAGARNVLVSLWRIDDEATSRVMDAFYGNVAGGLPLDTALGRAQKGLQEGVSRRTVVLDGEEVSYAHPYFWASFVLLGGSATDVNRPVGIAAAARTPPAQR